MKVILLKDVPSIGHKFEVKTVADGHALNFLIPRRLALSATPSAIKQIELLRSQSAAEQKIHLDLLIKNIAALDGQVLEMKAKVNEEGHLYAGIHKKELVALIKEKAHLDISEDAIELEVPLKAVWDFPLKVSGGGKAATFTVQVVAA